MFSIEGTSKPSNTKLIIKEWDAKKDWKKDYRTIWQAGVNFKSQKAMLDMLVELL